MKFYMKQKLLSRQDDFTVRDIYGNRVYTVEGEGISIGRLLRFYNGNHEEIALIRQKTNSETPVFSIIRDGKEVAQISKNINSPVKEFDVSKLGWTIHGSQMGHYYLISRNGEEIASVQKRWTTINTCYIVNVCEGADPVDILALTLIIDACPEEERNSIACMMSLIC